MLKAIAKRTEHIKVNTNLHTGNQITAGKISAALETRYILSQTLRQLSIRRTAISKIKSVYRHM